MGLFWGYYVGLDLGQAQDYTAISVAEEPVYVGAEAAEAIFSPEGWLAPADLRPYQLDKLKTFPYATPTRPVLSVRHLERFALGTKYPGIVARVVRLMHSPLLKGRAVLVVDATGVGQPVVDLLEQSGLAPIAVSIHGGANVTVEADGRSLSVPKRDLVGATQVLLQNGRLKVAESLPEAQTLVKELLAYRVKISANAHDTYSNDWREAPNDDLVLAVGLACWYREWFNAHLDDAYVGVNSQVGDNNGS